MNPLHRIRTLTMNGMRHLLTFLVGLLVAGVPIVASLSSKPSYAEVTRMVRVGVKAETGAITLRLDHLERTQREIRESLKRQVDLYASMDKKQAVLIEQVTRLVSLIEDTRRKDD